MTFIETLRQWQFPREFRISPLPWPQELAAAVDKLSLANAEPVHQPAIAVEQESPLFPPSLLADIGTGVWRLRQRMIDVQTGEPLEEVRRPFRHLQWIWDKLNDAGIQILDHTGERVPESGIYALKVVAYEAMPGLKHDQVIETIKPTIFVQQQRIQMGEVIVGTAHKK